MNWLWHFFNAFVIIWELIYPQPVADSTLPPSYVFPPDVVPPPEGGQCAKDYWVEIKLDSTLPLSLANSHDWLSYGSFLGPLGSPSFRGERRGASFWFVIEFSPTNYLVKENGGAFLGLGIYFTQSGLTFNFYQSSNNAFVGSFTYSVRYRTRDGSPDNCGSIPPPAGDRERGIPVSRPVPVPVPLPPVVTPPVPVPIPIPPAPPIPPSLPRPPLPITPPIGIDVDLNLNFNFYTDIDFNFQININNGTGTLPIQPFQALAKLLYAILLEVKESRRVIDRMAKQVDCLAEKFCREGKETYRLPLGIVGYSKRSLYGLPTEDSKLKPIAVQVLFAQIQNGAGRRVRPSAPNLYSPQALGYYAFQFESGGFGALEEIRFSQPYIPIPERAIAIAFWLEPQVGEGYLYCWYEKTKYENQEEPPSIAP